MKKIFPAVSASLSLATFGLIARPALAICPVCVVAVGAGLGLSEYLGIDDTVAGVWVGGLLISISIWTINWLNKKTWKLGPPLLRNAVIFILYYALTLWPLWIQGFIGQPANRLGGMDKLLLGTVVGSLGFWAATASYDRMKTRRGHAHFPFEKVAFPVGALVILSLVFYLLTK